MEVVVISWQPADLATSFSNQSAVHFHCICVHHVLRPDWTKFLSMARSVITFGFSSLFSMYTLKEKKGLEGQAWTHKFSVYCIQAANLPWGSSSTGSKQVNKSLDASLSAVWQTWSRYSLLRWSLLVTSARFLFSG